jgi:hypothetical protein
MYSLVFHVYINEMHGSRSKIHSKKSLQYIYIYIYIYIYRTLNFWLYQELHILVYTTLVGSGLTYTLS